MVVFVAWQLVIPVKLLCFLYIFHTILNHMTSACLVLFSQSLWPILQRLLLFAGYPINPHKPRSI